MNEFYTSVDRLDKDVVPFNDRPAISLQEENETRRSLTESATGATPGIGGQLVTPATAFGNSVEGPVTLQNALYSWSDGSLATHTERVRKVAAQYTFIRSRCPDHPADAKTCPNCRAAKTKLDRAKKKGTGHCYAGEFAFRHRFGLVRLSKIILFDYDGLDDTEAVRDLFAELPYCLGSRRSVTGRGVHAFVYAAWLPEWDGLQPPEQVLAASRTSSNDRQAAYRTAAANHPEWVRRVDELCGLYGQAWDQAVNQVGKDLGLTVTIDASAKDVARLLYDSHDDHAMVNLFPETLPKPHIVWSVSHSEGLICAALHALRHIHPPSDTNHWMGVVYNCRAVGLAESEVDSWSRRGERYENGELAPGGFLGYRELAPAESTEEALTALEVEAARQDPSFEPLSVCAPQSVPTPQAQSRQNDNGIKGATSDRAAIFPGQDLSAEVRQVIDAVAHSNDPAIIFSDTDATSTLELIGSEMRPVPSTVSR